MNILKQTVTALTLSFAALSAAMAAPIVNEYNTVVWNLADGVRNTVTAVGGMSYGGRQSSLASLAGTDVLVVGYWDNVATGWVAAGGICVMHDWGHCANHLPGLSGATWDNVNSADINVVSGASGDLPQ